MRPVDWVVLIGSLVFIVAYGLWKGRGSRNLESYLMADHRMRWHTIALAIMATQASAITFLSTPGQAYVDGMRFVQFYFGLPLAMIALSATAVPLYRRFKVYTAYEFLERRLDAKTRSLAALLFLVQRGLAAGLTIYAPALVLSVLLSWDLRWTVVSIGALVVIYTAWGGTKAVNHTQYQQFLIILGGMGIAFWLIVRALPPDVGLLDAAAIAGKLGKLNTVDFSWHPNDRYTVWAGLLGGFFLQLSYFGTDQSQVGRYITGENVTQGRLGLLFNGLVKVPMQFGILFLGVMVFVYYTFVKPPVYFNPVQVQKVQESPHAPAFEVLERRHEAAFTARERHARELVAARRAGDTPGAERAATGLSEAHTEFRAVREEVVDLVKANDPGAATSDVNYVFLSFVIHVLPAGVVGLVLAAIFAASMSSTAAELNALASTTVIDGWRRLRERRRRDGTEGPGDAKSEKHEVVVSRLATMFWGLFAIAFALFAGRLGSLVEAINILGSLFYGTILGIFIAAFFFARVGGTAVFLAALLAEAVVVGCYLFTDISFLWYNVVGAVLVVGLALAFHALRGRRRIA